MRISYIAKSPPTSLETLSSSYTAAIALANSSATVMVYLAGSLDGDGVRDHALDDRRIVQALDSGAGEDAMGGAHVDIASAHLLELAHACAQRARGVDHVVVDDAGLALDIADDAHDLSGVVARTALVRDRERAIEHVG